MAYFLQYLSTSSGIEGVLLGIRGGCRNEGILFSKKSVLLRLSLVLGGKDAFK